MMPKSWTPQKLLCEPDCTIHFLYAAHSGKLFVCAAIILHLTDHAAEAIHLETSPRPDRKGWEAGVKLKVSQSTRGGALV